MTATASATREQPLPSYEIARLSWPRVRDHLAVDPRLILAVGSLEQHGPHLPLGTTTIIADHVVAAVSNASKVLRAPPLWFGVCTPTEKAFAGAAGVQRKTLHRALNELLVPWEEAGVREVVMVTGTHYEPHLDALLMAQTRKVDTTVIALGAVPVGEIIDGDALSEHGGELETSLLLHLEPELVRTDLIEDFVPDPDTFRKYVRGRRPTPPPGSSGVIGRPSLGTARKGRLLFERYVHTIVDRILQVGKATEGASSNGGRDR